MDAIVKGWRVLSNRIDSSKQLEPGDHIYVHRNSKLFSHHGIYVGGENDEVIHFKRITRRPKNHICLKCGRGRKRHHGVVKTCLDCFVSSDNTLGGSHPLYLYDYGVSNAVYKFKKGGTCSRIIASKTSEEVVRMATELHNLKKGFGEYELIRNNCEHFATFCKTGTPLSEQVAIMNSKIGAAFMTAVAVVAALIKVAVTVIKFVFSAEDMVEVASRAAGIALHVEEEEKANDGDEENLVVSFKR